VDRAPIPGLSDARIRIPAPDHVLAQIRYAEVDDDGAPTGQHVWTCIAEIHQDDDDRWVVASLAGDGATGDYSSCDLPVRLQGPGYCYTYGRTLGALRRLGIRSYASPARALRVALAIATGPTA
jgi:hypothetical protein